MRFPSGYSYLQRVATAIVGASIVASAATALEVCHAAERASLFERQTNVVYSETHGVGLLMDVFAPSGDGNGLGIIDVVSGSWHSDRGKLRDHERAQIFSIFCQRGYTVFAIRPGSVSKFTATEMVANAEQGIRWVKGRAAQYQIDPNRLGIVGASAGGHLACLVAVRNGRSKLNSTKQDASVRAAGIFFPPTDLLKFGGQEIDPKTDPGIGVVLRELAFPNGVDQLSDDEVRERLIAISPARRVTENTPPFLLIHGTADPLVPIQQSRTMIEALQEKGVSAELIVKLRGGHPWPTIHEEVAKLADWFDGQLK
jgi:acetyl esterase/lipase